MSAQVNTESVSDDSKRKRKKTSWVWTYFKEIEVEEDGMKVSMIKCQEMNDEGEPCNTTYKNIGSSTGNAINHLYSVHGLSKEGSNIVKVNNVKTKSIVKPKHSEERQKKLRQFLVNWIINDFQPICVIKSPDLKILLTELDPAFIMPCQETIKNIVHEAFEHTLPQLKTLIKNEAISISLTLDLWTSKNRQGYLGVTCSFIDPKWKLKEFTLTIEHVRYPHTAVHILEALELILEKWEIRNKIYTITTDNGSNVKKAINDMEDVEWLGCVAHTLHLVVGKGMIPAQILILRVRRLINFFMSPKQNERLEEIQKQFPNIGDDDKEDDDSENNEEDKQNNEEVDELLKDRSEDIGKTADHLHAIADTVIPLYNHAVGHTLLVCLY